MEKLIKGKRYRVTSNVNFNGFSVGDIVVPIETGEVVQCVYTRDWNEDGGACKQLEKYKDFANWMNEYSAEPVEQKIEK